MPSDGLTAVLFCTIINHERQGCLPPLIMNVCLLELMHIGTSLAPALAAAAVGCRSGCSAIDHGAGACHCCVMVLAT
jgi:hypothetical protein